MIWFTTRCRTQRFSLLVSMRKHETSEQSPQVFKTMRYHKEFSIYVLDFTPYRSDTNVHVHEISKNTYNFLCLENVGLNEWTHVILRRDFQSSKSSV